MLKLSSGVDGLPVVPDDAHPKTSSTAPNSEHMNSHTVGSARTPGGSTNDLFLSTKTSTENTSEPPPAPNKQLSSIAVSEVLEKISNLKLGEEAMNVAKAVSEELLKKQQEEQSAGTPSEEQRSSITKSALNLKDKHIAPVLSPEKIVEGIVAESPEETDKNSEKTLGESADTAEVEARVATEVPPIETPMDEIDVESTGAEIQPEAEVPKLESPKVVHDTLLPRTEVAVPVQAEVHISKEAEDLSPKEAQDITKESDSNDTENPTVPEDPPIVEDKPISEQPIRQVDKDPLKKQASNTAEKTPKAPAKTSRTPSQSGNSGQTGVIAATGSVSATLALSPRSEKAVKQKSTRPASARSARGLGDLQSSSSGETFSV